MSIKSFILGSATILAGVSGVRAADAVVIADPEPVEYVRVCDVYGTGYFYIPGTETCLRVGGYVRFEVGADSWSAGDDGGHFYRGGRTATDHQDGDANDTYGNYSRLSLQTWTGSETDIGTLKTYTETRFNWENGGNAGASFTSMIIELGGLTIGKTESAFQQFFGYATASGINDAIIGYGPYDTNTIRYTKDFGGFVIQVAAEEGAYADTIDSYVPHLLAGAKYYWDRGAISGMVAYDSNYEEWAGKIRLDITAIPDKLNLALMATYGETDGGRDSNYFNNWGGDWAIHGGAQYRVNEKMRFNTQVSYADNEDFAAFANIDYRFGHDNELLRTTFEIDYFDNLGTDADGVFGGAVRIERSF